MRKKWMLLVLSMSLAFTGLTGCGEKNTATNSGNTQQEADGSTENAGELSTGATSEAGTDAAPTDGAEGETGKEDVTADSNENSVGAGIAGALVGGQKQKKESKLLSELKMTDLVGTWQEYRSMGEGMEDESDTYGSLMELTFSQVGHSIRVDYDFTYEASGARYYTSDLFANTYNEDFSFDEETTDWVAEISGKVICHDGVETYDWDIYYLVAMLDEDNIIVESIPVGEGDISLNYYKRIPDEVGDLDGEEISGQGGNFVQVGDKIFYRSYSQIGLEMDAVWGHFMDYPSSRGYGNRYIDCYDTTTGDSYHLFIDGGDGDIFYYNNCLYMTEYNEDEGCSKAYRRNLLTEEKEYLGIGTLIGVEDRLGYYFIEGYGDDGGYYFDIYSQSGFQMEVTPSTVDHLEYLGAGGGYAYLYSCQYVDGGMDLSVFSYDLSELYNGAEYGTIRTIFTKSFEEMYGWVTSTAFTNDGSTVYLAFEEREGSGDFFQQGFVVQADGGLEDSGKEIDCQGAFDEDMGCYGLAMDKHQLIYGPQSFLNKEKVLDLLGLSKDHQFISYVVEKLEKSADGYEAVVNRVLYNPAKNVGWRDNFGRLSTMYVHIDKDGKEAVVTREIKYSYYQGDINIWGTVAQNKVQLIWQPVYRDDSGEEYPAFVAFVTDITEETDAYFGYDFYMNHQGDSKEAFLTAFFQEHGILIGSPGKKSDYYETVDITKEMEDCKGLQASITFNYKGELESIYYYED